MSLRTMTVQYVGGTLYLPPFEREVNHIVVKDWEHFEKERTCSMFPSDYYPCAEDDCMRLSIRMWTCSECEADNFGIKPNFCPFCGAKVASE